MASVRNEYQKGPALGFHSWPCASAKQRDERVCLLTHAQDAGIRCQNQGALARYIRDLSFSRYLSCAGFDPKCDFFLRTPLRVFELRAASREEERLLHHCCLLACNSRDTHAISVKSHTR